MPHIDDFDDADLGIRKFEAVSHQGAIPRKARWLWRHRIPLGAITLLAGKQGLGKSTLTAEIAARVTHGELEGDLYGEPGNVLMLSYEDDMFTTIVPRLMAAGADLRRSFQLMEAAGDYETVSLPSDLREVEQVVLEEKPRLLIVDPLVASLPMSIDAHRDQDVRVALAPLGRLAVRYELAVLGLIHWNKSASTDALTRISGSTAFSAAARSVIAFGAHPHQEEENDGTRVIAHAKSNLGPIAPSLEYRLEPCEISIPQGEKIETVRIKRVGECSIATHELFSQATEAVRSKVDEAILFLRDELADGKWHDKDPIAKAAQQERIARKTLLKAASKLGVEFRRKGFPSKGQWQLPPVSPSLFDES